MEGHNHFKDWVRESVEMREQCYSTMGDPKEWATAVYDNTELLYSRLAQEGCPGGRPNQAYAARG